MRVVSILVLLLAACGGDDDGGGGGDGDGEVDASDPGDQPDGGQDAACTEDRQLARFVISSTEEYGSFGGAWHDVAMPAMLEEKLAAGGCVFWAPEPSFCDPPCDGATVCAVGGTCQPYPSSIPAGDLHVAGSSPELDLPEPEPGHGYYTTENYPSLFAPGDQLTLSGEGSGEVDAFEMTTHGVPELTLPSTGFTATEHQDMHVVWDEDERSPAGTRVVLHLDNDHHGTRAYVECWSDDTGEIVVPADVLDQLILAGETGIGTYIENAYLARIARGEASGDAGGCAVFDSESLVSIFVETIRAE